MLHYQDILVHYLIRLQKYVCVGKFQGLDHLNCWQRKKSGSWCCSPASEVLRLRLLLNPYIYLSHLVHHTFLCLSIVILSFA